MRVQVLDDGAIYVAFPVNLFGASAYIIPPEIDEWLIQHDIDSWGRVGDVRGTDDPRGGVFISGEDAVAFRLKFNL